MSQSEQFHEAWSYLRDHARPVVPDDVYFLRLAREDMPPSKAHRKRITLKSARPEVSKARPRRAPDLTARRNINQAMAHGARVAKLVGYVKPIIR